MGSSRLRHIFLGLMVLLSMTAWGQSLDDGIDRTADDFVHAGLIIADPGSVLYSVLGHACLHLQCPAYGMDYIFTYESEDVKGIVFRFLLNDLRMGMFIMPPTDYVATYAAEGRGVREYALNLPPEVKSELWRMCDERVAQGIDLAYDPVKRGCAISVVHSVEDAIKSANRRTGKDYHIQYPAWGAPFDRTLREIFYDNAPHGWGLFWCMTIVGGIVDKPHLPHKEKLICPKELADTWQQCTIDGKPLLSHEAKVLCEGDGGSSEPFTPLYASLIVLALALLSVCWKQPYIDWILLALQTIFGCLIVWLWLMPLAATGWSWLVIPFNPLPALFWKWRRYWALPYAGVIFLWCAVMAGELLWGHVLVDWPHILLAITFALLLLKRAKC